MVWNSLPDGLCDADVDTVAYIFDEYSKHIDLLDIKSLVH